MSFYEAMTEAATQLQRQLGVQVTLDDNHIAIGDMPAVSSKPIEGVRAALVSQCVASGRDPDAVVCEALFAMFARVYPVWTTFRDSDWDADLKDAVVPHVMSPERLQQADTWGCSRTHDWGDPLPHDCRLVPYLRTSYGLQPLSAEWLERKCLDQHDVMQIARSNLDKYSGEILVGRHNEFVALIHGHIGCVAWLLNGYLDKMRTDLATDDIVIEMPTVKTLITRRRVLSRRAREARNSLVREALSTERACTSALFSMVDDGLVPA